MLFIIIPSIILCAVLIYQYLFFIRVYYFGQSLHKFRELRHEVTLTLSANVEKGYSVNEAIEHQLFLLKINAIITYFDTLAPQLFKFKSLKGIYSKILFSSETLTSNSNNTAIPHQYKEKVRECLLTALKSIPIFRVQLIIFFLKVLAMVSIKAGTNKYHKQLNALKQIVQFQKDKSISCHS
jgi:hypothetical protein